MESFTRLSADTLFHFTSSLDNLIDILTNEFRPHFCLEDFNILFKKDKPHDENLEVAIPMVPFCDIPLSQTGFHLSVYGDYGIGMVKSWGKENGIAPVLYGYPGSLTTTRLFAVMNKVMLENAGLPHQREMAGLFYDFGCFVKPYEGKLWRRSGERENVRFYDEREWRFVPETREDFFRTGLAKKKFLDEEHRRDANEKLAEAFRISFEPNNIKYLIVRRDEEIVPLVREVERIKGKYSHDEVQLLTSRVISAEQIRSDF